MTETKDQGKEEEECTKMQDDPQSRWQDRNLWPAAPALPGLGGRLVVSVPETDALRYPARKPCLPYPANGANGGSKAANVGSKLRSKFRARAPSLAASTA
uniref:Uncharacterized protein n=1 Tax=Nelumbo nucifera TaxID=4432 RepID=A0A822XZY2_NELNU|nr:TPA_asm: hypothetical protein HUJ06_027076 [Nelumbo nucifera]